MTNPIPPPSEWLRRECVKALRELPPDAKFSERQQKINQLNEIIQKSPKPNRPAMPSGPRLRPALQQRRIECLKQLRSLHANNEKLGDDLNKLQERVDGIKRTIKEAPDSANEPAFQDVFKEHTRVEKAKSDAEAAFAEKVVEYITDLKGDKDRLARELIFNPSTHAARGPSYPTTAPLDNRSFICNESPEEALNTSKRARSDDPVPENTKRRIYVLKGGDRFNLHAVVSKDAPSSFSPNPEFAPTQPPVQSLTQTDC